MTPALDFHSLPNDSKHVYLIDDDASMRSAIKGILGSFDYQVHLFSSAKDFLDAQTHATPAVIVVDMSMPDLSGVELQAELHKRGWKIPMIFISGDSTLPQVVTAMKGGAVEFLLKPFDREELHAAVVKGLAQDINRMRSDMHRVAVEERLQKLTPREREVFDRLSLGYNNAQIQSALNISLPTAKQYKSVVMRKLSIGSLSELLTLSRDATARVQDKGTDVTH
jgi:two-component system response regulator TtrR